MKKTPLARRKPLKAKKPLKRTSSKFGGTKALLRGTELGRRTRLNPRNEKRRAKLYEKQFGDKGTAMCGMPCWVTGDDGLGFWPVDNAHVGKTRGAGADASMLARLRRDVHRSFDEDTDAVFEARWGTSKGYVRDQAREFDVIYKARVAEQGEYGGDMASTSMSEPS